jgi:HJR/Mrr/RecB family endonuclease
MSAVDPLDQLRKLAALKDEGIIAPAEYSQMKTHLLRRVTSPAVAQSNMAATPPASPSATVPPPLPTSPERVSEPEVIDAKRRLTALEETFRQVRTMRNFRRLRAKRLRHRASYFGGLLRARALFENVALGRLGPIAITTCLGVLVGVILSSVVSSFILAGGLIGGSLFFLAAMHVLIFPADDFVRDRVRSDSEEAGALELQLVGDERAYEHAKFQADQARQEFDSLLEKFRSRRNMLLSMDWRMLRGIPFELFLRDIFEELGFKVQMTKASGDQGVDLIAERQELRLAVQAKGFAESVGNAAVQQAHAGMAFYSCNRCVVVTNSTFTAAATELAHRIGCVLVDGFQIHDLILGKVRF